jgi:hypothetical protein
VSHFSIGKGVAKRFFLAKNTTFAKTMWATNMSKGEVLWVVGGSIGEGVIGRRAGGPLGFVESRKSETRRKLMKCLQDFGARRTRKKYVSLREAVSLGVWNWIS